MYRLLFSVIRKPIIASLILAGMTLSAQEYGFRSFRVKKGLNNLAILRIYQDGVGFILVNAEDSIYRYDGDRFELFGTFAEGPGGTIWIGRSGGHSRFKPLPHNSPGAPLQVVLTRIGETDVSGLRKPSFGNHANSLILRYSLPNAYHQNGSIFRDRLGGATTERELPLANLTPGVCRQIITARRTGGTWSVHSAEFLFSILTPWYSNLRFAFLYMLIPLLVVVGVLWLRIVVGHRRENELRRLVAEQTADLLRTNEELSLLSSTDPLTKLANRRIFDETLDRECARVQRMNSTTSLLIIDVDHFKALNDSEGHQKGDECLVAVGAELARLCRRNMDLAARCGGEEFAMILPLTKSADAKHIGESLRKAIADLKLPNSASPVAPFLTVSVGVATATRDWWCTPQALVAAADRALYAAKAGGRNRVCMAQREALADGPTSPSSRGVA
jgi:diguanylate cyclase (GGDEF)-like protein